MPFRVKIIICQNNEIYLSRLSIRFSLIGIYKQTLQQKKIHLEKEYLATTAIPFLLPLAVEPTLNVQQVLVVISFRVHRRVNISLTGEYVDFFTRQRLVCYSICNFRVKISSSCLS